MHTNPDTTGQAPLVLPEPSLKRVRTFIWGEILVLLLCLAGIVALLGLAPTHTFVASFVSLYTILGLTALMALACLFVTNRQRRLLPLLEQKRQRAVRGDAALLTDAQPTPNENALVLPFSLELRLKRTRFWRNVGLLLLFPVLLTILFFPYGDLNVFGSFFPFFLYMDVLYLIILAIFVWASRSVPSITVTQESIYVKRASGKVDQLAWEEARLFAIINTATTNRRLSPLIFELAGADKTLHFVWLRPELAKQNIFEPLTSYEEYNEQMQALLSVIAAKTGLPLYDLRKQMN